MNMIIQAARFAPDAHAGVKRSFTFRPYIEHPMRVAGRAMLFPGLGEEGVCAAWLHDVLEDCPSVSAVGLQVHFGDDVTSLVKDLTNPSKGLKMSRHLRKAMDREHLKGSGWKVRVLKLLDRIDNVRDMIAADRHFKKMYAQETLLLIDALDMRDSVIQSLIDELRFELRPYEQLA